MATVIQRFDQALASSTSQLSVYEVRQQMALVRSVQAVAAARLLDLHHRMEELATSGDTPFAVDPSRELRSFGGLRRREVRGIATQAVAAESAPALGELLAAGVTTAAHLETVGRALAHAGQSREVVLAQVDDIVHRAATMRVDDFDRYMQRLVRDAECDEGLSRFEQQRRRTHLRMWNDTDGMLNLVGCFDPERGAALLGSLERRVETMFHSGDRDQPVRVAPGIEPNDHRRALALLALCTGAGSEIEGEAVDPRPARAEVVVHVDLATLRHGLHAHSVCRTQHGADLPPATVRRLACEAEIIPVVLDGPSVPLDVGRSRRLATLHQRRALEAIHPTCAVPDCGVTFGHCSIHHLAPWESGGPTDLDNLLPLCSQHHHAVHEGGWSIRLDPANRALSITLPGRPVPDGTTSDGISVDTGRPGLVHRDAA